VLQAPRCLGLALGLGSQPSVSVAELEGDLKAVMSLFFKMELQGCKVMELTGCKVIVVKNGLSQGQNLALNVLFFPNSLDSCTRILSLLALTLRGGAACPLPSENGTHKTFKDRLCPSLEPFFLRKSLKPFKLFLLRSTADLPDPPP